MTVCRECHRQPGAGEVLLRARPVAWSAVLRETASAGVGKPADAADFSPPIIICWRFPHGPALELLAYRAWPDARSRCLGRRAARLRGFLPSPACILSGFRPRREWGETVPGVGRFAFTQWIFNKSRLYGGPWANGRYLQLVISASYGLLKMSPAQEIIDLCLRRTPRKSLPRRQRCHAFSRSAR